MTGRQFESLTRKYLLPHLPDCAVKGRLLFKQPLEYLLRAYAFEPSGWDKQEFRVMVFVQPLYEPYEHVAFSLSDDLGALTAGRELWWRIQEGNEREVMADVLARIQRKGEGWLERLKTPRDVARKATQIGFHTVGPTARDPHITRAVAYSWILEREVTRALQAFDLLEKIGAAMSMELSPWMPDLLRQTRAVRAALERDPEEAVKMLQGFREFTLNALRLTRWAAKTE